MSQHTPGPCSRAYISPIDGAVIVPCASVVQAANVLPLIAQAPALREALRQVERVLASRAPTAWFPSELRVVICDLLADIDRGAR